MSGRFRSPLRRRGCRARAFPQLLERLPDFRGVGTASGLVLWASEVELPWVDQSRYFGVDPAAPSLLLPTTRVPTVAVELVERAFRRMFGGPAPWLVDDRQRSVVPLARAGRIDRARRSVARESGMRLPPGLAPWRAQLERFPEELAFALAPMVQRLAAAVGPLASAHVGSEEFADPILCSEEIGVGLGKQTPPKSSPSARG